MFKFSKIRIHSTKPFKCEGTMAESKIQRLDRLELDEVCEMIADGASLAQIGAKFDRSRNVIWKFLHKNEEHRQAYLAALQERGFHHANMIERLVLKVENGEMRPDVARVAIDGRKWIASRFHPNLLSEKLIGNITHHQESIQEQHLQALKNILAKRKRRIEKEERVKAEGQLELAESKP